MLYPGFSPSYYLINSDGSGLKKVENLSSAFHPPLPPQLSPDGFLLAISGPGLEIRDTASGKLHFRVFVRYGIQKLYVQVEDGEIYSSEIPLPWVSNIFGPACWTPDGSAVRFFIRGAEGQWREKPVSILYTINRDGENLRLLYTITDMVDLIDWGDCSPDNREMAVSSLEGRELYVINLDTGKWRSILHDYYITVIRTWPRENTP